MIDNETLQAIRDTSESLVKERDELARYDSEGYLNGNQNDPWITVSIGNHPTYLRDFKVRLSDINLRGIVTKAALKQTKMRIKELEIKLTNLIKELNN